MVGTSPRTQVHCCWDRSTGASGWCVALPTASLIGATLAMSSIRSRPWWDSASSAWHWGMRTLNDHDELRKDPTFAVLAGKLSPVLRTDCEPLAGKSTLNRLEHTPRRHASKYHKIDCDDTKVDGLLVDLFLEAHERAPREIVLDLDNTDIPLHGEQEGRFFHGYYKEYLLPAALRVLRSAPAAGPPAACERRGL